MSAYSADEGAIAPRTSTLISGQDATGRVRKILVGADGSLQVSVSVSSSGSAIQDGVNPAIKATVKAYTNSNPLAVINVDTSGNPTGGSAVSIADGADVAQGSTTDAAVTTNANGTVVGFLRGLVTRLLAQVLDYDTGAGTASQVIFGIALPANGGPVGVSNTNPLPSKSGFGIPIYDYVALAVAATTDTYTFKVGGSGGTLVGTLTLTYTDSTKATLSTAVLT